MEEGRKPFLYDREEALLERLEALSGMLTAFTLPLAACLLGKRGGTALAPFLLLVPGLLLCRVIRRKCRNFFLFVILHLLVMAPAVFLAQDLLVRIALAVTAVAVLAFGLWARIRGEAVLVPTPPFLLIGLFVCFLGASVGNPAVTRLGYWMEAVSAFLCLAYRSTQQLREDLFKADRRGSVPLERIRNTNRVLLSAYGAGTAAVVLAATVFGFGEEMYALAVRALKGLARLLVALLLFLMRLFPEEQVQESGGEMVRRDMSAFLQQTEENPLLKRILDTIYYALVVLVILLILRGIILALRELYRRFLAAQIPDADIAESLSRRDVKETVRPGGGEKREKRPRPLSPEAGVRRAYRKLLAGRGDRKTFRPSMTPAELERTALGEAGENTADREKLHLLYETARYMPERTKPEDVRTVREIAGRLPK